MPINLLRGSGRHRSSRTWDTLTQHGNFAIGVHGNKRIASRVIRDIFKHLGVSAIEPAWTDSGYRRGLSGRVFRRTGGHGTMRPWAPENERRKLPEAPCAPRIRKFAIFDARKCQMPDRVTLQSQVPLLPVFRSRTRPPHLRQRRACCEPPGSPVKLR